MFISRVWDIFSFFVSSVENEMQEVIESKQKKCTATCTQLCNWFHHSIKKKQALNLLFDFPQAYLTYFKGTSS